MTANGIDIVTQDNIVQNISSFALYGFPESHAASFALIAYPNRLVCLEEPEDAKVGGEVQILTVTIADPDGFADPEVSSIAVVSRGLTTVAVPVKPTANGVQILPLAPNVPRLFCDFPLLGTEAFLFPVIINNPTFNPTEPRDGIFLTKTERPNSQIDHNKTILKEALALYLLLLDHASENDWQSLHLLAATKIVGAELARMDHAWYKTAILTPMRETLLRTSIVRTAANTLAPIHSADGETDIWFPSSPSKEVRRAIWRCCKNWIPGQLPEVSDIEIWHDIIWAECNKLTLDQVAEFVEKDETIENLAGELQEVEVHLWLMNFYATLETDEAAFQAVVAKRAIFPNQKGLSSERRTSPGTPATSIPRFWTSSSYWETTCATSFSMWRSRRSLRTSARRTGPSWSRKSRRRSGKKSTIAPP